MGTDFSLQFPPSKNEFIGGITFIFDTKTTIRRISYKVTMFVKQNSHQLFSDENAK